jgi:hypothetical protein
MNRSEAYQICHELMLTNPNYVLHESAGLTYMLVQISDRSEEIGIHSFLINPAIPEEGDMRLFTDMTEDQQIGVLSLPVVAKTIGEIHQKIIKLKKLSHDAETRGECIKKLRELFNQLGH